MKPLRNFAIAVLFATLATTHAGAAQLLSWDWDDGTTQGWTGTDAVANVGNQFRSVSNGIGALQFISPDITGTDLSQLVSISFDLTVESFSTVSMPGDLAVATLSLANPSNKIESRLWDLDLSGLYFNETRTFNLPISEVQGSLSLAEVEFVDVLLQGPNPFAGSGAAGRIDNLVFTGVPEPSSLALLGLGGIALVCVYRVRMN